MGECPARTTTNLAPNLDTTSFTSPNYFMSIIAPNSSPSSTSTSSDNNIRYVSAQRHFHDAKGEAKGEANGSERSSGSSVDSVFGPVPTRLEVGYAISAFQSFMMQGLSSTMLVLDRIQPMLNQNDPRMFHSTGFQRVCHAFRLLQTVPAIQRMVVSISSDKAVWDAVTTNTEVQNFQQSFMQGQAGEQQRSNDEPNLVSIILKWILDNMKLKILELIETLKTVLTMSFNESPQNENSNPELNHGFEEMIVSTVLLSTITLMIVLVTRAYGADA